MGRAQDKASEFSQGISGILLTGGDPAGISPEIIPPAIRYWKDHAPKNVPLIYFCTAGEEHISSLVSEFSASLSLQIIRDKRARDYLEEFPATSKNSNKTHQKDGPFSSSLGQKTLLLFDLPSLLPLYVDLQKFPLFRSSYFEPQASANPAERSSYSESQASASSGDRNSYSEPHVSSSSGDRNSYSEPHASSSSGDRNSYYQKIPETKPAEPTALTGLLALLALDEACFWIEKAGCLGLVTAPLSKEHVDRACRALGRPAFHGHTGFLADRFSCEVAMLMHGRHFSVLPLTTHIALRDVPSDLQKALAKPALEKLIEKICHLPVFATGGAALCALNPHGGEGGLMGTEELDFLSNWAETMRDKGIPIEGPLAADGLFISSVRKNYRLILACYHDQGLIPFKAIEGAEGVNVTIGLPFLRTSPDHGTAFGIAGKGLADATSMVRSLALILSEELR